MTPILSVVFGGVLTLRFLYPFYRNPHHELWSDMQRHWDNGQRLLDPNYVNSADPKTYQVWLFLLRWLSNESNEAIIALFTGFLCAGMAYCWYRALREICPKNSSLLLASLIGLHPSLLLIYGYFLNETVALTFTSLALWMTLRAARKKTLSSFNLTVLCCLIAVFSKLSVLPVMGICWLYLWMGQEKKWAAFLRAAALLLVLAIPAGFHTLKGAHVFSPFGYTGREAINRDSGFTIYRIQIYDMQGRHWSYNWSSPSFYINPFHPFGKYTSYRKEGTYIAAPINLDEGRAGWNREIDIAAQQHGLPERIGDLEDNLVYLFLAPSWPDSDLYSDRLIMRLAFHARWLWPFCLLTVLVLAPFCRLPPGKMLLVCIAYATTLLLLFQQMGVMEGRYRKPLEPFLIVSSFFILAALRQKSQDPAAVSLKNFVLGFRQIARQPPKGLFPVKPDAAIHQAGSNQDATVSHYNASLLLTRALGLIFMGVLALRFLYPFYYNPYGQIWSDMIRHWDNGQRLFAPVYVSSVDPKTYQVWLTLLRWLANDNNESVIALFTGLLCSAMAYFWYRALRELCTKNTALGLSIVLGLHPSLLLIYGFFMNETVALTFTGVALWMTLRAARKKTAMSFNLATFFWLVAVFSKQSLVPIMGISMLYLLFGQQKMWQASFRASIMFLLFALPASLHTLKGAYIFSPFGYTGREVINRDSGSTIYEVRVYDTKGWWWIARWASDSFNVNPLYPFADYSSYRKKGVYTTAPINLEEGRAGWNREIEAAAHQHSFSDMLGDMQDNFVYLFLGPSWPDSGLFSEKLSMRLAFHARWLWPFCLLTVLVLAPFCRLPPGKMLLVCIAYATTLLLLFQQMGVMEGRYRKPLEPFLIVSSFFILAALRQKSQDPAAVSLKNFVLNYCLPKKDDIREAFQRVSIGGRFNRNFFSALHDK